MKKPQSIEVELSLAQIIQKEAATINDLKKLSDKIAEKGSKDLYLELENKEKNLETLKLARLKINQTTGNDERIIKLSLLKRKEEVLQKIIDSDKKRNIFQYITSLVKNIRKNFFTKEEVENKLKEIKDAILAFNNELFEFNNTTKLKLQLIT
jgi:ribosome-binding ATPase YchF (GTP1/OBG family)